MSQQSWSETLVAANVAGTLFNTYTTAKTVLPTGALVTLPANYWYVGRSMRMTILGAESHRVTGPDTMTFQFNLGAVAAFSSGVINLTTTAHTTIPFKAECIVTCRSIGASTAATLIGQWLLWGQGFAMGASLADGVANTGWAMGPNTAPAVGTGWDSTATQNVDLFVAQSVSNAGNGVQIHQYLLESLN